MKKKQTTKSYKITFSLQEKSFINVHETKRLELFILLPYFPQENYDPMFKKKVYSAPVLTADQVRSGAVPSEKVVRVEYSTKDSFKRQAKLLGIMDDFKVGVQSWLFSYSDRNSSGSDGGSSSSR